LIGWLLDTNVVASLTAAGGAPSVHAWAAGQPEDRLFLSVLTLAEYDKGIHNLPEEDPGRWRHAGALAALEARFTGRILSLSDNIVRRWGAISGRVRRATGHPPPVIDILLAATALEHDLYFATRNTSHVARSGAALFNPCEDDPLHFPLAV
jgi:predicted nucleic acid-binding protein